MTDYDQLAEMYFKRRKDKTRFDFNRDIEVPAMINLLGNVKGKKLLDMGCGFGDHAKKLSKQHFKSLAGFDISGKLIKLAEQQKIPNTYFYVGDMRKKLAYPAGLFDIVYASLSIHYVKNISKLFTEVNRVLKKGGVFCFSTAHPIFNLLYQSNDHIMGFKKDAEGKRTIWGNYFNEKCAEGNLVKNIPSRFYCYTYETLIMSAIRRGFELTDYVDAKPVPSSKKYGEDLYKLTTTLPTVILFKFKKK